MHHENSLLNNVGLVLVRPKYAENVGAAARVAFNMGISRLIVVRDEMPDHEAMAKMATHKAAHILDKMELHKKLEDALAPFSVIAATTARRGRKRILEKTPRELIQAVLPDLPNNQLAIMFGPENTGLTNDEIKFCQYVSAIPTADFSSLNLAQAVAIHCYELYYQLVYEQSAIEPKPSIASSFELEGMYEHVENALLRVDFLQEKVIHTG